MITYFIFLFTVLIYITQRQHSITKNLPKKTIPTHYLCMLIYTCKKKKIKSETLTISQKTQSTQRLWLQLKATKKKSQKHLYN